MAVTSTLAMHVNVCQALMPEMLLHGQVVGQNSRSESLTVWNNVVLSGVYKLKSKYTLLMLKTSPLTCIACT